MSNPAPWNEVSRLLGELLDEPDPAVRAATLQSLAPEIRSEVESLLAAEQNAGAFLGHSPLVTPRLGPYRLLQTLGHGGMGIVYRASREDGEFQQDVAIKLLLDSAATADAERRFLSERQILASLQHPNIVRLLDGGIVRHRRYFVMELIHGVPLNQWTAPERTLPERLTLFRKIAAAVHHAHQNLVIHRDLKPSNILVQSDDEPKLLDFGIAKLLQPGASLHPTDTIAHRMTIAYSSPEQVRGLSPTIASDIYSLGALLYEILTGQPAQPVQDQSLDTAIDTICHAGPPRLPASIPNRHDLDSIVAKAMQKEPARRYASAEELSSDILRYLQGLPVLARDATFRYVAARWIRRHRLAAATAAIVILLIAGAIAAVLRQNAIASRERARAESRFNIARQLAQVLMFEAQRELSNVPGAIATRKLLVERGLTYLESLSRDAQGNRQLQAEIAAGYAQVGYNQWNPNTGHLGDLHGAGRSYQRSIDLWRELLASDPSLPYIRQYVFTAASLGTIRNQLGQPAAARELARQAVDAAQRGQQRFPSAPEAPAILGSALFSLASHWDPADAAGRVNAWTEALQVYEAILNRTPDDLNAIRNVALVHKNIVSAHFLNMARKPALPHALRALELDLRRLARNPNSREALLDIAIDHSQYGTALLNNESPAEGILQFRKSLAIRRQLAASDPQDMRAKERYGYQLGILAANLVDTDLTESQSLLTQAMDIYRSLPASPSHRYLLGAWRFAQGRILDRLHRPADACRQFHLAVEGLSSPVIDQFHYLPQAKRRVASCLPAAR